MSALRARLLALRFPAPDTHAVTRYAKMLHTLQARMNGSQAGNAASYAERS